MSDVLTSEWLDGPGLTKWLRARQIVPCERIHGDISKRFREWESGRTASIYTVDRLLTHEGRHLSELPDELYVEDPRR